MRGNLVQSLTAAMIAAFGIVAPASAVVILSNYPFTNDGTQSALNPPTGAKAIGFVMPAGDDYKIDSVVLRLQNYDPADVVTVEIRNDTGGTDPGPVVIGTLTLPVGLGAPAEDYTATPVGEITLTASTKYWLMVTAVSNAVQWRASSPAVTPTGLATFDGNRFRSTTSWTSSTIVNTFQINGSLTGVDGDLQISITDAPDPLITPATDITYTVSVLNDGLTTPLTNINITGTIPAGMTFVSSTLGSFTMPDQFSANIANLPAGDTVTFNIVLSTTTPATYDFILAANATEMDPLPDSNTATATTLVRDPAVDLRALVSFPVPCPALPDTAYSFDIDVESLPVSEVTATGITLTVELDPSFSMITSFPAGTLVGTTLTIPVPDIAPGGVQFITVDFTTGPGPAPISFSAASAQPELTPANNSGGFTVLIGPAMAAARGIWTDLATASTSDVPGLPGVKFSVSVAAQDPVVSRNGQYWLQVVDTDAPTSQDGLVIRGNGTSIEVVAREGVTLVTGAINAADTISVYDARFSVGDDGAFAVGLDLTGTTTTDKIIARGAKAGDPIELFAVAQESQPIPSVPGANFGASNNSPQIQINGTVSFYASMSGPPTTSDTGMFGSDGQVLLVREDVTIPGNQVTGPFPVRLITSTNFSRDYFGDNILYTTTVDNSPAVNSANDQVLVYNNTVVIQEGTTHPDLPATFTTTPTAARFLTPTGIWIARGSLTGGDDYVLRQGEVIARTDDPIIPMSTELFDDATLSATFFFIGANDVGDYVVGGRTNSPDTLANDVLILNGTSVLARENDPVDLDGDGLFNDDRYIRSFTTDRGFITNDGFVYIMVTLRTGLSAFCGASDTQSGTALIRIPFTPTPALSYDVAVNGQIDIADLALVLSQAGGPSPTTDFNRSGQVTVTDAKLLLLEFGTTLP